MAKRGRTGAQEPAQETVKLSVPIPRMDHARLAWLAAASGRDRGELAAEFIRDALRHIVIQERTGREGRADHAGQDEAA